MNSKIQYLYFPINIFIGIWIFLLFLYFNSELNFFPIRLYTIGIILSSLISVILGYVFYQLYFQKSDREYEIESKKQSIYVDYSKLAVIVIILCIITSLFLFYYTKTIADERGGLVKYFANPVMSRNLVVKIANSKKWDIYLSLSTYGVNLSKVALMLAGILFTSDKIRYKLTSLFPLLLGFSISIINFSRYTLITTIFIWLFSFFFFSYYLPKERNKKVLTQFYILSGILVLLFVSISFFILSLRLFTKTDMEIKQIFLRQLNYYLTGNIIGFDQFLNNNNTLYYGGSLFRSVFKWLARFGVVEQGSVIGVHSEFVRISPQLFTNTYTYLRVFVEDFGEFGQVIQSFLWGVLSAFGVNYYLKRFSLIRLYIVVLISIAFFMSFFGFYFVALTNIILDILLLTVFSFYLSKMNIIHYVANNNYEN